MYVVWNSSIPYKLPSHSYTCMESTHPPSPSLVENITVTSCLVNVSAIALFIEWLPPSVINGELSFYDVWIGGMLRPLDNTLSMAVDHITVQVCYMCCS